MKILRCPVTGATLVQAGPWLYTTDPDNARKYPIRGGIPVLMAEAGQEVGAREFQEAVADAGRRAESPSPRP